MSASDPKTTIVTATRVLENSHKLAFIKNAFHENGTDQVFRHSIQAKTKGLPPIALQLGYICTRLLVRSSCTGLQSPPDSSTAVRRVCSLIKGALMR
jgi:hypothetical protein